jgi:hypothetical protein
MCTKAEVYTELLAISNLPASPITTANLPQVVEQYHNDLQDIGGQLLTAAVTHYRTSANPFFPSSGQIREKATELQLLAMGIPTAAEAWAQVQRAYQYQEPVFCDEGMRMRTELEGTPADYWQLLNQYGDHVDACGICDKGGFTERYAHPAVASVVEKLGGRDMILTDNEVADRAKFFESYNAIVKRETLRASLPVQARQFVETKQLETMQATKLLSERLTK